MFRLAKTLLRESISRTPVLREKYFEWQFLRRGQTFKGIYRSFAEATAASPARKLIGYNHKETVVGEDELEHLNQADYPILFWLAPLLSGAGAVFDLGGNLGLAYFAYRKYLTFPPHLRWIVCEVPATVAVGEELARKRGESKLVFTEHREAANEANIYFSGGALQYIEEPFAEILAKLERRPSHVLINRVPLCEEAAFITLQNNGAWTVPYKAANRGDFIAGVEALGYELVDSWRVARSLKVLMSSRTADYYGMYFRLR